MKRLPVLMGLVYIFYTDLPGIAEKAKRAVPEKNKKRTTLNERGPRQINVASLSMAFEASLNAVVFAGAAILLWLNRSVEKMHAHPEKPITATSNLHLKIIKSVTSQENGFRYPNRSNDLELFKLTSSRLVIHPILSSETISFKGCFAD